MITALNGNGLLHMYLRLPTSPWTTFPSYAELRGYPLEGIRIDLIKEILRVDAVELILTRGPKEGTVEIFSHKGSSQVEHREGKISYVVVEGDDPLSYPVELHKVLLSPTEWKERSFSTEFPLAPFRLWKLFWCCAVQPPDFILTAKPGYDFGLENEPFVKNYRGSHGGLRQDQMIVPIIIRGPGIKPESRIPSATIEDAGATLLSLMGVEGFSRSSAPFDGQPLSSAFSE